MKSKASPKENGYNGCRNNRRESKKVSIPMSENRFLTCLIRQVIFSRCCILENGQLQDTEVIKDLPIIKYLSLEFISCKRKLADQLLETFWKDWGESGFLKSVCFLLKFSLDLRFTKIWHKGNTYKIHLSIIF